MFKKKFLTLEDEKKLVEAISEFEKNTSGEVRIHIENKRIKDAYQTALGVFEKLKMNQTKLRNGVLIYVNPKYHKVAIIGDEGINNVVSDNFWEDEIEVMLESFKQKQYYEGLEKALQMIADVLKIHFPFKKDDIDELPNSISR